ncbi:MAG TPA: glycoside hydrolase family 31 protein [Phycisphaerae bacterium]|nr:glycoside hydrolase family 31 protein [Phycisphaerae bacterium]
MTTYANGFTSQKITPAETRGWQSLGRITGVKHDDRALVVECGPARLRISAEVDDIIRVRLAPNGIFRRDHSWAVVDGAPHGASWRLREDEENLYLITPRLRVHIRRNPCRISFHEPDGSLISADDPTRGVAWAGSEVRCWKRMNETDRFFGFGERGSPMNKRGQTLVNWNTDAAEHDPWTDPLYQSHPFFFVLNDGAAHGLFFDNAWRASFDLGKASHEAYSFGADGGEMNYYFIPGPAPRDVLQRYTRLVGPAPLPPMWSLGYQQCRWSYESAKRVRGIAKRLREHKIPCDTIYIDIDYMDGYRCFTWDGRTFPKPDRLMKELRKMGYRVVVILDPGIKRDPGYSVYDEGLAGNHFCYDEKGEHYIGRVWPGETVFPDFTRPETREWWGSLYKGLLDDGVTGFWNDMNEPADFSFESATVPLSMRHDNDGEPCDHRAVHNVYGMQMARSTYEGVETLRSGERPFVLTRAGYSGVQRYAAVWTGDNLSSWEHLRMSIPMLLNMSVSGISFIGADIGGFRGDPTPELFTRWLQTGIFYPLCRTHTCGGMGKDGAEQDPTVYGRKHEKINRRAIELRYELLPYIYTQLRETERSGDPLLRPIWFDEPMMEKVHRRDYEFFFGKSLFVAPVVQEGARKREFVAPPGDWFDFFSGRRIVGGEETSVPVDLKSIPMYARAGAIIPTREAVQFTDEAPLRELTLNVFAGSGAGTFYNDDGLSYGYRDNACVEENYRVTASDDKLTLEFVSREGDEQFAPKSYAIRVAGLERAPDVVTIGDRKLTEKKTPADFVKAKAAWRFDKSSRSLHVRSVDFGPGAIIEISFGAPSQSRRRKTAASR